jgi:hypothetical protein
LEERGDKNSTHRQNLQRESEKKPMTFGAKTYDKYLKFKFFPQFSRPHCYFIRVDLALRTYLYNQHHSYRLFSYVIKRNVSHVLHLFFRVIPKIVFKLQHFWFHSRLSRYIFAQINHDIDKSLERHSKF